MPKNTIDWDMFPNQLKFVQSRADEVMYGGAAGGGKTRAQIMDAFLCAMKYPGIKQLFLRRTLPELEKSVIRDSLMLYPRGLIQYNSQKHTMSFVNGSIIDYGYCESENDVFLYKSSEYDIIRFDELTTFTEFQYTYLITRNRGANKYPKQMKSSTNPGDVGHAWVKARFIDPLVPNTLTEFKNADGSVSTREFIPSRVDDNIFLMHDDPGYKTRLQNMPESQKKALLYGDWDIFEGRYFTEFDKRIHVCKPTRIPEPCNRYFVMDYGLDALAGLWIAVTPDDQAYVYREIFKGKDAPKVEGDEESHNGLMVSAAAARIKDLEIGEPPVIMRIAPPDLWGRRSTDGKSPIETFADNGLYFTKASNDRVAGWLAVKEWLKPYEISGKRTSKLHIFENCPNLIRCLPLLQYSKKDGNDAATDPHEITHLPDALRYWAISRPCIPIIDKQDPQFAFSEMQEAYEWNKDPYAHALYSGDATEDYLFGGW